MKVEKREDLPCSKEQHDASVSEALQQVVIGPKTSVSMTCRHGFTWQILSLHLQIVASQPPVKVPPGDSKQVQFSLDVAPQVIETAGQNRGKVRKVKPEKFQVDRRGRDHSQHKFFWLKVSPSPNRVQQGSIRALTCYSHTFYSCMASQDKKDLQLQSILL